MGRLCRNPEKLANVGGEGMGSSESCIEDQAEDCKKRQRLINEWLVHGGIHTMDLHCEVERHGNLPPYFSQ